MKKLQYSSGTRLTRVLQAGTVLGLALFTASALHAQNYGNSILQLNGVTTPDGVGQIPGIPVPLGATQDPPPLSLYPVEAAPELTSTNPRRMREFLNESARETQTAITLADIAAAKAQSVGVKKLAESVRTEQSQKYSQLQALAPRCGVVLAQTVGSKNQREINRLQKAGGEQVDREYTKFLLAQDVNRVNCLEKAAREIRQPEVASYAVVSLPAVRNEVRRAEYAASSVGVDQGTIASILNGLPSEDREVALNGNNENNNVASR
jgi:predicted outer membrane protein